jgi:hypothetical protein
MMVWAFLFFLPVSRVGKTIEVKVLPDVVGWLIMLVALRAVVGGHPLLPRLRVMAAAGAVACIPQAVEFHTDLATLRYAYAGLYGLSSIIAVVFVWDLCALVAAVGEQMGRADLRTQAFQRRAFYLFNLLLPAYPVLAAGSREGSLAMGGIQWLVAILSACTIALMMVLMARTARLCRAEPGPQASLPGRGPGEPGA